VNLRTGVCAQAVNASRWGFIMGGGGEKLVFKIFFYVISYTTVCGFSFQDYTLLYRASNVSKRPWGCTGAQ